MKTYMEPSLEIVKIEMMQVIAASIDEDTQTLGDETSKGDGNLSREAYFDDEE